ncbi:MAG: hypothetical protein KF851_14875 [Pirellulaceae bacterium]|nr:hypothetical protein [Pirellulaceae bacterium]
MAFYTNQDILNHVRSSSPNPTTTVADAIKDASGNLIELIDPRGVITKYEYDSRSRQLRQFAAFGTARQTESETIYNLASQVIESRSPRYFDSSDSQNAYMKAVFTYNGRGLQASSTIAPGGGAAQAITSQTYTLKKGSDPLEVSGEGLTPFSNPTTPRIPTRPIRWTPRPTANRPPATTLWDVPSPGRLGSPLWEP